MSNDKEYKNLPSSDKMMRDQRVGFVTSGYIDKKGTPNGLSAAFNWLPPGQDISDQYNADIRDLPMKEPMATGYEGDGWKGNDSSPDPQDDEGASPNIDISA